jgi:hypothetical protein
MKRICILLGLGGILAASNAFAAFDGTVTMYGGPFQNGEGGEFTAVSPTLGTFQTFCLEIHELIGFEQPYNFIINRGAVAGGGGATATDPHTGKPLDPLSIGTAWLYSQFRAGTLPNYFDPDNAVRLANAGLLQHAFWELEGELPFDSSNKYIHEAENALVLNDTGIVGDANGAYGVVALNMYLGGDYSNLRQDQLSLVPEPSTIVAGALLLLPFGASTLRVIGNRKAA